MALSRIIYRFYNDVCIVKFFFYCISSLSAVRFSNWRKVPQKNTFEMMKSTKKRKKIQFFIHEKQKIFPSNCNFVLQLFLLSGIWFYRNWKLTGEMRFHFLICTQITVQSCHSVRYFCKRKEKRFHNMEIIMKGIKVNREGKKRRWNNIWRNSMLLQSIKHETTIQVFT